LSDWFFKQGGTRPGWAWTDKIAWLDGKTIGVWEGFKDRYTALTSVFARMHISGTRKFINEVLSEGLTLATGGLVVMYGLALPAFNEADQAKWRTTGQYSVTFQDQSGNEIGRRGINIDDAVPLEEIPDALIKATLATEDRRFFEHYGVDLLGTLRALVENVRANDVVQGGSTLTQQLAKNLFLSSERSITRKIKEAFLAIWLEAHLSKREILKLYLDRAYMGGGAFGAEAAAQFYFGKSVRDISMAEAAMMAGLYKAPTKYAPHVNLSAARARANEVLSNLVEAGFYTAGEVYAARLNPAKPIEQTETRSPDWFLDWAFDEVQRIMRGRGQYNLTVRTTVDLDLQNSAEQILENMVKTNGRWNSFRTGAIVTMEPDGAVRALVGGVDYGESQFNRATRAKRQPGSSFKTYVYAAAIAQEGYTERSTLRDVSPRCGRWAPRNYNGSYGSGRRVSMTDAFRRSLNTTAVQLSFAVGRKKLVSFVEALGIEGVRPSCSIALGDTGITPLEHTAGYAVFANGGKQATPYGVLEITNSSGQRVYLRERDEPKPKQLIPRRAVEVTNRLMHAVVEAGTGKRAQLDFTHAVGKTGTSSNYRDAWFVGFTGKYVTSVWLGNDNYRPMYKRRGRGGVTGGSYPAQTWQSVMQVAHRSMAFDTIPGLDDHPTQVAERRRLEELRRTDPLLAAAARAAQESGRQLPAATRRALEALAENLGLAARGETAVPPGSTAAVPREQPPVGTPQPEQRAEDPNAPSANRRPRERS
jgi:penicillin-binding protein 1A